VQIPGRVLPAGTYWFIAVETNTAPRIIEVFNSDRSTLYATILTNNAERSNPTDDTAITFANRGSLQPETIVVMATARLKQQIQTAATGD
jgi:hypothetical protein